MKKRVEEKSRSAGPTIPKQAAAPSSSKILHDVFLAFVRVHLLHHAAAGRIYGLEMIEELRRHGCSIGPGTLYPILHELERSGYVTSEQELAGGKVRKYYRITASGRTALTQLRAKISELVEDVLAK